MKILVLNGPNVNLLGCLNQGIYGSKTLNDINRELVDLAAPAGFTIESLQSNHEGVLLDRVHTAILQGGVDAIIANPGPLRHTSVALADALSAFEGLIYEVHIVKKGDAEFRHPTIMKASRQFCGPSETIYRDALKAMLKVMEVKAPLKKVG